MVATVSVGKDLLVHQDPLVHQALAALEGTPVRRARRVHKVCQACRGQQVCKALLAPWVPKVPPAHQDLSARKGRWGLLPQDHRVSRAYKAHAGPSADKVRLG
jgi:hypothetical protein